MTVPVATRKAGPFAGNGIQVTYGFAFKIFATTDVVVTKTALASAGGAESTLVLTTDYTVVMNADQNNNPGGSVTVLVAPAGDGTQAHSELITISSSVPESQGTSLPTGGQYSAKVVETAIDKCVVLVGQLRELFGRSPFFGVSDTPAANKLPNLASRKSSVLGFDSNGNWTTYSAASGVTDAANVGYTPANGALAGIAHTVKTFLDKLAQAGASLGAALIGFLQSGSGAVATDLQSRGRLKVHVFDFMTAAEKTAALAGTATVGVRASLQKAIDAVRAAGGGDVEFGPYPYLIDSTPSSDTTNNGLLVPYSADEINGGGTPKRVRLLCTPQTRFLAGNDNMIVIRFSDSLGAILGFPSIENNGHIGVWGVGLVPESMSQTTTSVFQCYNELEIVTRGVDVGLVLKGGPTVAGRDSGCWYNDIHHYHFGGLRGRWLKPPANGTSIVNNRNVFRGRVGGGCNVGTFIESGTTNRDYTNYEGINVGVSPEATPTGVIIRAASDNADNEIYGVFESCTRYIENAANSTKVYCPVLDESKCLFTVRPVVIVTRLQGAETQTLIETQNFKVTQNAPATPKANRAYADSLIKAWGCLDGRAATFTVFSAMNCSVVRNGVGDYTVTITTVMSAATNYSISAIATDNFVQLDSANLPAVGSFKLLCKTSAGAAVDPVRLQFMIVGRQ